MYYDEFMTISALSLLRTSLSSSIIISSSWMPYIIHVTKTCVYIIAHNFMILLTTFCYHVR